MDQSTDLLRAHKLSTGFLNADAIRGERGWLRTNLLQAACGTHALGVGDQFVVSGASFLTTVLVGRATSASELGIYAVGVSLLIALVNIHEALVSLPYTIQRDRPLGTPAEHAGSSLILSSLLSVLAMATLAAAALAMSVLQVRPELIAMTWAVAAVAPLAFLREFSRRFAFAHLHVRKALILDIGVAAVQLGMLGMLAHGGWLSATMALGTIGVACGLSGAAWLYRERRTFAVRADRLPETARRKWGLGKWLFANHVVTAIQVQITYWLLLWMVGTAATGIYAACMSVTLLANPFIQGLNNILCPKAAVAFSEGGETRLRREILQQSLLLGMTMLLFCLLVMAAGEDIMQLLYPGRDYAGYGQIVMVLALEALLIAIGMPVVTALSVMECARANFWIGLIGTVITAILVALLVFQWGLLGAAYGVLAGSLARLAARWSVFLTLARRADQTTACASRVAAVTRVLQQLTRTDDSEDWTITELDEGSEAHVYAIHSSGRQPDRRAQPGFIIKLYKQEAALDIARLRGRCDAMLLLRAALDGRTVHGWKTFVAAPLYVSESPLALVTTIVPGQKLHTCLEGSNDFTMDVLNSASYAIAGAMAECWSDGQSHGDLTFENILCDVRARHLAFIDVGAHGNCCDCCDVRARPIDAGEGANCSSCTKHGHPAVHELAHVLYDLSMTVKSSVANSARFRKQAFAESLLRAVLQTIGPIEEKRRLLDELHGCARLHVKAVARTMYPCGRWRRLTRRSWQAVKIWSAFRTIDAIIGRMRIELDLDAKSNDKEVITTLQDGRGRPFTPEGHQPMPQ